MAIAVEVLYPGATTAEYDAAVRAMGLTSAGEHPGALFHWAAQTDAGVKVVDVWASEAEMQRFVDERVVPAGTDAGLPDPELTITEIHAYMVGAG